VFALAAAEVRLLEDKWLSILDFFLNEFPNWDRIPLSKYKEVATRHNVSAKTLFERVRKANKRKTLVRKPGSG
jgi:hypothetical protein